MRDDLMHAIIAFMNEFFPDESKEISFSQLLDFIDHYLESRGK